MAADQSSGQGNKQEGGIWPTAAGETEPGGLVPPYEDRTGAKGESGDISEELSETVERQMADSDPGNIGAIKSPANESPVGADEVSHGASGGGTATATDPTATSARGVGESVGRRGEDVKKEEGDEAGRQDLGTKGQTERPYGTTDARDSTSINTDRSQPVDDDMMNTGGSGTGAGI
jgi:hypothetical protein